MNAKRAVVVLSLFAASLCCAAQTDTSDTNVLKITSPIQPLELSGQVDKDAEPYKSGKIGPDTVPSLLETLKADKTKTTIIHVLRWKDKEHTAVMFQKWYLYDPTPSKTSFYLQSKEQAFQRTAIPGRTDLQLIYIHINFDLAADEGEWLLPAVAGGSAKLAHPINYTVTVTKQQTQFIKDLQTVLQIVFPTGLAAAAVKPHPGYYSVATFNSQWTTSSITVAASLDSANKTQGNAIVQAAANVQKKAKLPGNALVPANAIAPLVQKNDNASDKSSANNLSSNTYTNEKPSYVGLSAGVQITSYKDITYQSSSGTLVPSSITKQNVYLFLDGYYPAALPSLTTFRYIPHPFFGMPIKGKVLRHTMLGAGVGLRWLEPYGGIVFDTENNQIKRPNGNSSQLTLQYVFGVKTSVSAVATALKKSK